jgi:hypothetical protein
MMKNLDYPPFFAKIAPIYKNDFSEACLNKWWKKQRSADYPGKPFSKKHADAGCQIR